MGQVRPHSYRKVLGLGGISIACYISVTRTIYSNAITSVILSAANIAAVDKPGPGRVDLDHIGIKAAIMGQIRPHFYRKILGLGGMRRTCDIGTAGAVHCNTFAIVTTSASDKAAVDKISAIGFDLGHKGIASAIVGQVRPHSYRKTGLGGLRVARNIGAAGTVNSYAVAIVD